MNTGQMLLVTGALALLGLTVVSINRSHTHYGAILNQTEVSLFAVTVASSYIELASSKLFDEVLTTSGVNSPSDLSSVFGLDPGEIADSVETYDDFDDFHNCFLDKEIKGVDKFRTRARVYYVDANNPNLESTSKTYFKKIDLFTYGTIIRDQNTGISTGDTIKLSYLCSIARL